MKVLGLLVTAALFIKQINAAGGCQGDVNIMNQGDLNAIRGCKTYSGNIHIDSATGNDFQLSGIELIEGDLIITNNEGLQKLSMSKLQGINGQLKLSNNKLLNSIDVSQLYALRSFEVSVHPALNELKFPAGLSQSDKFVIDDTTITRVEGLKMPSIKEASITNNIYLKNLVFSNVTSVGTISVSANSPTLSIDMGQVETLREGTFRNVAQISLDHLKKVNGDISFNSNSFESLDLPALTEVSGTLTLIENGQLSTLSMPQLKHLGGALALNDNAQLNTVNGFETLEQVDGTLDITGGFDELQFPALADVRGGLNVQTSSSTFSCDVMNKLKNGVIKGNAFVCKSAVSSPKSATGNGSSGGKGGKSGSSSSKENTSDANLLTIHSGFAIISGALIGLFVVA